MGLCVFKSTWMHLAVDSLIIDKRRAKRQLCCLKREFSSLKSVFPLHHPLSHFSATGWNPMDGFSMESLFQGLSLDPCAAPVWVDTKRYDYWGGTWQKNFHPKSPEVEDNDPKLLRKPEENNIWMAKEHGWSHSKSTVTIFFQVQ